MRDKQSIAQKHVLLKSWKKYLQNSLFQECIPWWRIAAAQSFETVSSFELLNGIFVRPFAGLFIGQIWPDRSQKRCHRALSEKLVPRKRYSRRTAEIDRAGLHSPILSRCIQANFIIYTYVHCNERWESKIWFLALPAGIDVVIQYLERKYCTPFVRCIFGSIHLGFNGFPVW